MNLRQKIEAIRMEEKELIEKKQKEIMDDILSRKDSIVLDLEKILIEKWRTHANGVVKFRPYVESKEEQEIVRLYSYDQKFLREKILNMGFYPYFSEDFISYNLYVGTKWQIFIECPFSIFHMVKDFFLSFSMRYNNEN